MKNGFFVEFGACDGLTMSNTKLLEETYGWSGVLAEPNPIWRDSLFANRSCAISTDCVSSRTGETIDFISTEKNPELSRIAEIVPEDVHEREGNRQESTHIPVTTISLNHLLIQYTAPQIVDYLSIDTEGSEFEILRATDLDHWKFRFITVEHAGEQEKRSKIHSLLTSKGYERWRSDLSRWDDWYVLRTI